MMVDPDKWAEKTAGRLKQKADQKSHEQSQQKEEFILRRKMLEEQAPQLWTKTREAFQRLCDSFNKQKKGEILFFADIGEGVFHIRYMRTTGAGSSLNGYPALGSACR